MMHRAWEMLLSCRRLPKSHPASVDIYEVDLEASIFAFAVLCTYIVGTSEKHIDHFSFGIYAVPRCIPNEAEKKVNVC